MTDPTLSNCTTAASDFLYCQIRVIIRFSARGAGRQEAPGNMHRGADADSLRAVANWRAKQPARHDRLPLRQRTQKTKAPQRAPTE